MLEDGQNGSISSKRVITFIAFLLCGLNFICNLFWGLAVHSQIYESMIYLTMAGLGVTIAEKFAPTNKGTP
jgi:hypothetical protein